MDYLIKIAAQVLPQFLEFLDWKWLIVGSGEEQGFFGRVYAENRLEGRLVLTGRVQDVNAYLRKAQIYVMTSRAEGLAMCLLRGKGYCVSQHQLWYYELGRDH